MEWVTLVTVMVNGPVCFLAVEDVKLTVPPAPVVAEAVPLTTPLQVMYTVAPEVKLPSVSLIVIVAVEE